ncbi:MAG: hypothetical protein KBT03_09390 [Bacteroidales bacterium]|nr:hypothetical protein [Candidatus Scybalousia scybalohippi]
MFSGCTYDVVGEFRYNNPYKERLYRRYECDRIAYGQPVMLTHSNLGYVL